MEQMRCAPSAPASASAVLMWNEDSRHLWTLTEQTHLTRANSCSNRLATCGTEFGCGRPATTRVLIYFPKLPGSLWEVFLFSYTPFFSAFWICRCQKIHKALQQWLEGSQETLQQAFDDAVEPYSMKGEDLFVVVIWDVRVLLSIYITVCFFYLNARRGEVVVVVVWDGGMLPKPVDR